MLNLLTEKDKQDIIDVISYSQDIKNPKIDGLLYDWAKAKKELSDNFLNKKIKFTHPKKVTFCMSDEERTDRFDEFLEYLLDEQLIFTDSPLYYYLLTISAEEFFTNVLSHDYTISEKDNKIIKAGTKVVKSFKYFLTYDEGLETIQNKASEFIQEDKVTGYLTFSVHPLDFLSLSENNNNWRSCHALNGDYRAGNLSYMCDSSTMVVYLSSDKKEILPRFPENVPWNSKKWRVLFYFDTSYNVCFAGRQYPFSSYSGLEIARHLFVEMLEKNIRNDLFFRHFFDSIRGQVQWSNWDNEYIKNQVCSDGRVKSVDDNRYFVIKNKIYDSCAVIKDSKSHLHYNDLLKSSVYIRPYYMYRKFPALGFSSNLEFNIGSEINCLCCGEKELTKSENMICQDCLEKRSIVEVYCEFCGRKFNILDGEGTAIRDLFVCNDCLEDIIVVCEECGREIHLNEAKLTPLGTWRCNECLNNNS